jgi:hypothetical protein
MNPPALISLSALTQLTRLELTDCRRLNENSLKYISQCSRIVAFGLGNWATLSDFTFRSILENWPTMKKLNLIGTETLTDLSFSQLCSLSNLVSLKIGKNTKTTANWLTSLTDLKHLTHFELINMSQITDYHLSMIGKESISHFLVFRLLIVGCVYVPLFSHNLLCIYLFFLFL